MTQLSPPRRSTDLESVNASIKARAAGKSITLDVQQSRQPIGNTLAPASKCKVGICYRPEEPFDLVLFVDKAEYDRTSLLLPTKAKLVEIPVTRAAFVAKTTPIDFEEGTLTKEIGRASGRERGCQYVWMSVVAVHLKQKKKNN